MSVRLTAIGLTSNVGISANSKRRQATRSGRLLPKTADNLMSGQNAATGHTPAGESSAAIGARVKVEGDYELYAEAFHVSRLQYSDLSLTARSSCAFVCPRYL
jgi:hypothetical protein